MVLDHPAMGVAFEEGYWTFNMIADHLAESGITLERLCMITGAVFYHQKN